MIREAVDPGEAYLAKRHWHEHVNFFTEEALVTLLEGAGLRVVERTTFAVTVGDETFTSWVPSAGSAGRP